jgi:hypothetical protein
MLVTLQRSTAYCARVGFTELINQHVCAPDQTSDLIAAMVNRSTGRIPGQTCSTENSQ